MLKVQAMSGCKQRVSGEQFEIEMGVVISDDK
jgi:hypothetical protein